MPDEYRYAWSRNTTSATGANGLTIDQLYDYVRQYIEYTPAQWGTPHVYARREQDKYRARLAHIIQGGES
jgi:hypothetical protein